MFEHQPTEVVPVLDLANPEKRSPKAKTLVAERLSITHRLEIAATQLEKRPVLLFSLISLFYLVLIAMEISKGLWFDELFTYYISSQPTIQKMLDANWQLDLNPPLSYFVVRGSQALFGQTEFATRLPSVIGFWIGSAATFIWLGKRSGYLVAAGAITALWTGFFLLYATDARPYGLLLGFFGCALYIWDRSPSARRPWLSTALLLMSTTAMMLTHVLAPFSICPLCLAELVITVRSRKVNLPVWLALLLPVSLELLYLPWMRHFETFLFPHVYEASFVRIIRFYGRLAQDGWRPALIGLIAAAIATRWSRPRTWVYRLSASDIALGIGMLAIPYAIVIPLMKTHGAFHWRYAIVGSLAIWAAFSLLANYLFRNSRLAAAVLVFGILIASVTDRAYHHLISKTLKPGGHPELAGVTPELPLVAASGLTFLELDHYESRELTSRLYYLTDLAYATEYSHATLWEGYRNLKGYFPMRGNIDYYQDFIKRHKHFLVLGTDWYPEDWLIPKLQHDRTIKITLVKYINLPYKDKDLYDVQRID